MALKQSDVDIAVKFADRVRLEALLDSDDNEMIDFKMLDPIPEELTGDVRDLLEIAIQYYQRSVFTGEYLIEDDSPPKRPESDPIDDINFYLSYYRDKLIEELKKAYDLDDDLQIKVHQEERKINPYAQAMLEYRKEMMARQKKDKKD